MKYTLEDFTIQFSDLEIKCKPWTSLEERKYLSVKTENSNIADLARAMIFPNIEFKPMTVDEFKYLAFKLRALSVNPSLTFNYKCSGCNRTMDQESYLDDLLHLQDSKLSSDVIISEGDISVTLRRIPTSELLLKVLSENDITEQKYLEFLASIKTVKYKDEEYTSFTFEELKTFFDDVPAKIFNNLYTKFFDVKGHLRVYTKCTCGICQKSTTVTFDNVDVMDFL